MASFLARAAASDAAAAITMRRPCVRRALAARLYSCMPGGTTSTDSAMTLCSRLAAAARSRARSGGGMRLAVAQRSTTARGVAVSRAGHTPHAWRGISSHPIAAVPAGPRRASTTTATDAADTHATRSPSASPRATLYSSGVGCLGALGHPDFDDRKSLTRIEEFDRLDMPVSTVSCGWGHSACTMADGTVLLWGRPFDFKNALRVLNLANVSARLAGFLSRLSSQAVVLSSVPMTIVGAEGEAFVDVACGAGALTAAATRDGGVYCVGVNHNGECGNGVTSPVQYDWVPVAGLDDVHVTNVRCGFAHTLALTADGQLYAWGRGHRGQLGIGDVHSYKEALPVSGRAWPLDGAIVSDFDAGFSHSAAVTSDGRVWAWGKMQGTELRFSGDKKRQGDMLPDDELLPRELVLPDDAGLAVSVACGHAHVCVATESGRLFMTGMKGRGAMYDLSARGTADGSGDGDGADPAADEIVEPLESDPAQQFAVEPVEVPTEGTVVAGRRVVKLRAGLHQTYGVLDDGTVAWWGWALSPSAYAPAARVAGARDIVAGLRHTLVLADA